MKYTYREGIETQSSRRWLVFLIGFSVLGMYMLVNVLAPEIYYVIEPADTTAKQLISTRPVQGSDKLYIPKINISVPIVTPVGDESDALKKGAVQRSTKDNNPRDGGAYVIAASRFNLGLVPKSTYRESPFYQLGRVTKNDDVYVDYAGTRYAYKVEEVKTIATSTVSGPEQSESRLYLSTAETDTSSESSKVVVAKPVGTIVWTTGQPRLQSLTD